MRISKTPPRTSAPSPAGPLLIAAFGLFLIALALLKTGLNLLYELDGRAIVGTVLYTDYARDPKGMPHSSVTYRFSLRDGRAFEGHQTGYSPKPGESILLEYLAHHPSVNRVAGAERSERKWLLPVGGVGLLFLFAGIQSFVIAARRKGDTASPT